ncbi:MAG: hypothetical protein ABI947_22975 [Chloroflexota bacterium]
MRRYNHLARRELSKVSGLWLDCGNDKTNGQVCLGNTSKLDEVKRAIKANQFSYLPNAALLFPQLLEPEPTPEPIPTPAASCANLVEMGDQALLVNDMVGIVAGEYLYKLLNRLSILSFLTYIDCEALSMRSLPITPDNLGQFILRR